MRGSSRCRVGLKPSSSCSPPAWCPRPLAGPRLSAHARPRPRPRAPARWIPCSPAGRAAARPPAPACCPGRRQSPAGVEEEEEEGGCWTSAYGLAHVHTERSSTCGAGRAGQPFAGAGSRGPARRPEASAPGRRPAAPAPAPPLPARRRAAGCWTAHPPPLAPAPARRRPRPRRPRCPAAAAAAGRCRWSATRTAAAAAAPPGSAACPPAPPASPQTPAGHGSACGAPVCPCTRAMVEGAASRAARLQPPSCAGCPCRLAETHPHPPAARGGQHSTTHTQLEHTPSAHPHQLQELLHERRQQLGVPPREARHLQPLQHLRASKRAVGGRERS